MAFEVNKVDDLLAIAIISNKLKHTSFNFPLLKNPPKVLNELYAKEEQCFR